MHVTFFYHEDDPCCTRPKREHPLQRCLLALARACLRKTQSQLQKPALPIPADQKQTTNEIHKTHPIKNCNVFQFSAAIVFCRGGGVRRRARRRQAQGAATAAQQRSLARRQERSERNRSQGRNRTGAWDSRGVFLQKV